MAVHSTAVANRFLQLAKAKGLQLTQMQLQKLVYISHGWSLAILGKALTMDAPQAFDYGPVYTELWEALRRYGSGPVSSPIKVGDFGFGAFASNADEVSVGQFEGNAEELISSVFENYGHFHAFQLSAMTHEVGTPWHQVYVKEGRKRGQIQNDRIRDHFIEIAKERKAA